jgi:hypothetical protein
MASGCFRVESAAQIIVESELTAKTSQIAPNHVRAAGCLIRERSRVPGLGNKSGALGSHLTVRAPAAPPCHSAAPRRRDATLAYTLLCALRSADPRQSALRACDVNLFLTFKTAQVFSIHG